MVGEVSDLVEQSSAPIKALDGTSEPCDGNAGSVARPFFDPSLPAITNKPAMEPTIQATLPLIASCNLRNSSTTQLKSGALPKIMRLVPRSESAPADPIVVLALSCLFGDDEVAEIGSLFRGSFRPEDE